MRRLSASAGAGVCIFLLAIQFKRVDADQPSSAPIPLSILSAFHRENSSPL